MARGRLAKEGEAAMKPSTIEATRHHRSPLLVLRALLVGSLFATGVLLLFPYDARADAIPARQKAAAIRKAIR